MQVKRSWEDKNAPCDNMRYLYLSFRHCKTPTLFSEKVENDYEMAVST